MRPVYERISAPFVIPRPESPTGIDRLVIERHFGRPWNSINIHRSLGQLMSWAMKDLQDHATSPFDWTDQDKKSIHSGEKYIPIFVLKTFDRHLPSQYRTLVEALQKQQHYPVSSSIESLEWQVDRLIKEVPDDKKRSLTYLIRQLGQRTNQAPGYWDSTQGLSYFEQVGDRFYGHESYAGFLMREQSSLQRQLTRQESKQ